MNAIKATMTADEFGKLTALAQQALGPTYEDFCARQDEERPADAHPVAVTAEFFLGYLHATAGSAPSRHALNNCATLLSGFPSQTVPPIEAPASPAGGQQTYRLLDSGPLLKF